MIPIWALVFMAMLASQPTIPPMISVMIRFMSLPPMRDSTGTPVASRGTRRTNPSSEPIELRRLQVMHQPFPHLPPQLGALIAHDRLEHRGQAERRAVADQLAQLGGVGQPPLHVLEPGGLVRLGERHAADLGAAVGVPLHHLRQLADRDVLGVADVEHLARGARVLRHRDHGVHRVPHPGEGAPLLAVAVHGDRRRR